MIKLTERMLHAIIAMRNETTAFAVFCSELAVMSDEMTAEYLAGIPGTDDVNAQKREDITRGIVMTLYTLSKCFKEPEEALEHIRIIAQEVASLPELSSV